VPGTRCHSVAASARVQMYHTPSSFAMIAASSAVRRQRVPPHDVKRVRGLGDPVPSGEMATDGRGLLAIDCSAGSTNGKRATTPRRHLGPRSAEGRDVRVPAPTTCHWPVSDAGDAGSIV
jgi:hypothetical protein